jgi:hypothetical protein
MFYYHDNTVINVNSCKYRTKEQKEYENKDKDKKLTFLDKIRKIVDVFKRI